MDCWPNNIVDPKNVEITSKYSANERVFKKELKKTTSNDAFKMIFETCEYSKNSNAELQEHVEQLSSAVDDLVTSLHDFQLHDDASNQDLVSGKQPSSLTCKPSSDLTRKKAIDLK